MPDKRSWKEKAAAHSLNDISADEARQQMKERLSAEFAARQRCRCKNALIIRKYMNAGLCLMCGQPKYDV